MMAAGMMMLFPLAFGVVAFIAYIVFLVAAWGFMRAQESLAESARRAVGELRLHEGD